MWPQIIETLSRDEGILLGAILGSLGIIAATVLGMTAIITEVWRRIRQTEDDNTLKQMMLERGMSADEISTVVSANSQRKASFSLAAGRGRVHCQS